MTKTNIEALVKYYKNKAKLNNFHFHMLKHSIAVHLLEI
jgi:site-specific recombinase XerD